MSIAEIGITFASLNTFGKFIRIDTTIKYTIITIADSFSYLAFILSTTEDSKVPSVLTDFQHSVHEQHETFQCLKG